LVSFAADQLGVGEPFSADPSHGCTVSGANQLLQDAAGCGSTIVMFWGHGWFWVNIPDMSGDQPGYLPDFFSISAYA
jgi:hypothetical protein